MTAFNIVRFRVKPGRDQAFIDSFKKVERGWPGMRRITVVKTGDGTYCSVGEWKSFDHIVAARPLMIGILDSFRHHLEELGAGLGVTDPVSGSTVLELNMAPKPAKKKPAKKKAVKKSAKKKSKKRRGK
jgi:hypothetical protein